VAALIAASSPAVRSLAQQGLSAASVQPQEQAYVTHDQYLQSVISSAQATPAEKLVASTLRQSTSESLKYHTALGVQRVALRVLAAGVSGPIGQMLGRVGVDVTNAAYDVQDQYKVNAPWIRAIEREGEASEQAVARAALAATSQSLKYVSACHAQNRCFEMVSAGHLGAPEQAMSTYATRAMQNAYNVEDQHAIARQVLPLIKGAPTPGGALATLAYELTGNSMKYVTAVSAEAHAFNLIAAGATGDVDRLEARFGTQAVGTAYDMQDQYLVAGTVLATLGKSANASVAAFARASQATTVGQGLKYVSAVRLQQHALQQLESGVAGPLDRALAQLGRTIASAAYDPTDQYQMGSTLLDHVQKAATDSRVQALVRYAKGVAAISGVTYQQAIDAQKAAFDGIATGNCTIPVALPAGSGADPRLVIPAVDDKAPPEEQAKALEDSIAHNRDALRQLEDASRATSRAIAEIQTRQQEIKNQAEGLSAAEKPLLQRREKLGKGFSLGGLVAAGGFIATVATSSPIALAVGAVGGAVLLGTGVARARTDRKIMELRAEASHLTSELINLQVQATALAARGSATAQGVRQAEKLIADAQGRLDVLRMATAKGPDPNGTVKVDDEFVIVGGLKIPRNGATKMAEQPASADVTVPS